MPLVNISVVSNQVLKQHRLNHGIQEEHFQRHITYWGYYYISPKRWNNLNKKHPKVKAQTICMAFALSNLYVVREPVALSLSLCPLVVRYHSSSTCIMQEKSQSKLLYGMGLCFWLHFFAFDENSLVTANTILDMTNFHIILCFGDWGLFIHSTFIICLCLLCSWYLRKYWGYNYE